MRIETDRLIIRSIERGDEVKYAEMAKDGSLDNESEILATILDSNIASWRTAERSEFKLLEKKYAIGFYLHQGFELIGFDTCCYTNNDIGRREVRINLGFFFHREARRK